MSITDSKYQALEIHSAIWSAQNYYDDMFSRTFSWALNPALEKELINQGYQVTYGPLNIAWPKETFTIWWKKGTKVFEIPEIYKLSKK